MVPTPGFAPYIDFQKNPVALPPKDPHEDDDENEQGEEDDDEDDEPAVIREPDE